MTTEKPADVEMKEDENKENVIVEKTQEEKDALSFDGKCFLISLNVYISAKQGQARIVFNKKIRNVHAGSRNI